LDLGQSLKANKEHENLSWPRELYGEGLLRLWSDNIYARIMAFQETPESREAVLAIGRSIVKDRMNPPRPNLLESLPVSFRPGWMLRRDRTSYFRSHLVLNSLYYLGQENMLDLSLSTEAVTSSYEREAPNEQKRIQFLLVKYPDHECSRQALTHFHRAYLPEHPLLLKSDSSEKHSNVFPIEDGWLGYKLQGNIIAFIFECPDRETARTIIDQM
jgi:hypothetical protein